MSVFGAMHMGLGLILVLLLQCVVAPESTANEANAGGESQAPGRESSDAQLRRLVAEHPEDDPLNAFWDPYDVHRPNAFAYHHPITYPRCHANPPIPSGFLPPNAPATSLPADFFFDKETRGLVASEHAASFCPYLRRWREQNPLKPYPIEPDFLERHPPIKYSPERGYEIDEEQAKLDALSHQVRPEIVKQASEETGNVDESGQVETDGEAEVQTDEEEMTAEREDADLAILRQVIKAMKREKAGRCERTRDFLNVSSAESLQFLLTAPASCMEEAIFRIEALEDMDASTQRDEEPERTDKPEYYRQLLVSYRREKSRTRRSQTLTDSDAEGPSRRLATAPRMIKNAVPDWAQLASGEELFSDTELVFPERYAFSYCPVPFPSIQNTLQHYVNI